MITDISIRGYVVGPIWWPAGADKEAELRTDDPEYIPAAIRCDATIDMFTGRVG